MKDRYEVKVFEGRKMVKRLTFNNYDEAINAHDKMEMLYTKASNYVEFRDRDPFNMKRK